MKSAAGQASYYYSQPFFAIEGTLQLPEGDVAVTGNAWLDREWSSQPLAENQTGWDWFSLQLRDGRNLMYYQLRRQGDEVDPHSSGSLSDQQGLIQRLGPADVSLTPLTRWQGYPIEWRLHLRGEPQSWRVRALLEDQEMRLSVRYWEGAVQVVSEAGGSELGRGYMELAGYH